MEPKDIQLLLEKIIGEYGIWVIGLFIMMFFKDFVHNIIASLSVFFGNDINEDDIVYVNGRKARVTRTGFRKTIFYMVDNNTKMIVPNERLKSLTLEKKLNNGKLTEESYND